MKERIQKILAAAGVASRRHVEAMVLQGRISVNGKAMRELPLLVDPQKDRIEVDGEYIKAKPSRKEPKVYLLMNKPKGVFCTNVAQGVQVRAVDLLGEDFPFRVYPVGRLDAESKGLLILTNDGELTNQLTHPRYGIAKTYRAVVEGYARPELVEELQKGVWLADEQGKSFRTRAAHIAIVRRGQDKSVLEITLREGRNRQVRRMLASLGHKVRELTRIRLGSLEIKGLAPGQFRDLRDYELRQLKKDIAHARESSLRRKQKAAAQPLPPAPLRPQPSLKRIADSRPQAPARPQQRPARASWPLDPRRHKRQA